MHTLVLNSWLILVILLSGLYMLLDSLLVALSHCCSSIYRAFTPQCVSNQIRHPLAEIYALRSHQNLVASKEQSWGTYLFFSVSAEPDPLSVLTAHEFASFNLNCMSQYQSRSSVSVGCLMLPWAFKQCLGCFLLPCCWVVLTSWGT